MASNKLLLHTYLHLGKFTFTVGLYIQRRGRWI